MPPPDSMIGALMWVTGVGSEQPLVAYFKEYRRAHSLVPHKTGSWAELVSSPLRSDGGDAGGDETTVAVGPARVRCVRTLRVPDDGKEYPLPPVRAVGRMRPRHRG
jgi:hypothetical protein